MPKNFLLRSFVIILLFLTLPFSSFAVSEETKKSLLDATSQVREATYETKKAALITATNAALLTIREVESQISNSQNLTSAQKKELLAAIEQLEKTIQNYQNAVKQSANSDQLLEANKKFANYIKQNKEQIRASISKVIMIGVQATLEAAKNYLETAKAVSSALKLCGSNTATLDQYINKAEKQLYELEKLVIQIMADEKVSKDESNQVKQAARLSAQLSTSLVTITSEALVIGESCPVAEAYLQKLDLL